MIEYSSVVKPTMTKEKCELIHSALCGSKTIQHILEGMYLVISAVITVALFVEEDLHRLFVVFAPMVMIAVWYGSHRLMVKTKKSKEIIETYMKGTF